MNASFSFMRNQRKEAEKRLGKGGIYYISDKKFYHNYFKFVGASTFPLKKNWPTNLITNLLLKLITRFIRHMYNIRVRRKKSYSFCAYVVYAYVYFSCFKSLSMDIALYIYIIYL